MGGTWSNNDEEMLPWLGLGETRFDPAEKGGGGGGDLGGEGMCGG